MDLASCDAREVRLRFNATSHGANAAGGAPDPEKPKVYRQNTRNHSSVVRCCQSPSEVLEEKPKGLEPMIVSDMLREWVQKWNLTRLSSMELTVQRLRFLA
eukprot:symbB.v1.2.027926.t1/scaffold2891.1/size67802/8